MPTGIDGFNLTTPLTAAMPDKQNLTESQEILSCSLWDKIIMKPSIQCQMYGWCQGVKRRGRIQHENVTMASSQQCLIITDVILIPVSDFYQSHVYSVYGCYFYTLTCFGGDIHFLEKATQNSSV